MIKGQFYQFFRREKSSQVFKIVQVMIKRSIGAQPARLKFELIIRFREDVEKDGYK